MYLDMTSLEKCAFLLMYGYALETFLTPQELSESKLSRTWHTLHKGKGEIYIEIAFRFLQENEDIKVKEMAVPGNARDRFL